MLGLVGVSIGVLNYQRENLGDEEGENDTAERPKVFVNNVF